MEVMGGHEDPEILEATDPAVTDLAYLANPGIEETFLAIPVILKIVAILSIVASLLAILVTKGNLEMAEVDGDLQEDERCNWATVILTFISILSNQSVFDFCLLTFLCTSCAM